MRLREARLGMQVTEEDSLLAVERLDRFPPRLLTKKPVRNLERSGLANRRFVALHDRWILDEVREADETLTGRAERVASSKRFGDRCPRQRMRKDTSQPAAGSEDGSTGHSASATSAVLVRVGTDPESVTSTDSIAVKPFEVTPS